MIKNQKGFTLIEIIAVLVILGILAAVAVPKYLDLSGQARIKAAQGAIAEIKGRLSTAQSQYILNNGVAPTASQLVNYAASANAYANASNLVDVGTDFTVTQLVSTASPIIISVTAFQSTTLTPAVNGNFTTATGN
jgi:MSHA pilin protein MshA